MDKTPKIMIADDMQMIRRRLKTALIEAGMTGIVEARNGLEAVAQLEKGRFDLIVCEWELPGMSGIELLRSIRQDGCHQEIPFMLLTAVAQPENIHQAIIDGVSDYIVKPVKPDLFLGKVKHLLQGFFYNQQHARDKLTISKWVIS